MKCERKIPFDFRGIFSLLTVAFFVSCSDKHEAAYTDVFYHVEKNTGDTLRYYGFKDLDTAVYYAKRENKDILAIFSGYACMAVGGQEWQTLSLFQDQDEIYNKFVIAWLAVDDKRLVKGPVDTVFWYGAERALASIGDKHQYLQQSLYGSSTQPYFCFMDANKKPFGPAMGYSKSREDISLFIDGGLAKNSTAE